MSIEIKQLMIKSNIVQRSGNEEVDVSEEQSTLKEALLTECRHLIMEIMREKGER